MRRAPKNKGGIVVWGLFDGISCGQVALERAGIKVKKYYAFEINTRAMSITQSNYPHTIQMGDVTKWREHHIDSPDLILVGSPCQGFSFAGKRLNLDDPRSILIQSFVDIKKEYPDAFFISENVKMEGNIQGIINDMIGVLPIAIDSRLLSCQRRSRLYWTNIRGVKKPKDRGITFKVDTMEGRMLLPASTIEKVRNWKAQQDPLSSALHIGIPHKLPCLTARGYNQLHSGMVLLTDGEVFSYLTNEEAELAQTLPVGYTKCETDVHRAHGIGNGWTVDVIAHILRYMKNGKRRKSKWQL